MNPFTESTVAQPLPFRRLLRAAGMAALLFVSPVLHAIDVNVASQEQLLSVKGIGPKTAQTIIDERARGGRYLSFDDLSERVKGIGPKKSVSLQAAGLTVGEGKVTASGANGGSGVSDAVAVPGDTQRSRGPGAQPNRRVR